MPTTEIELTLVYEATNFLPTTMVTFRANRERWNLPEATIKVGHSEYVTTSDATLPELAFRYRQKRVSSAMLIVDGIQFTDIDGDGLLEFREGRPLPDKRTTWQVVIEQINDHNTQAPDVTQMQWLYEVLPVLTGIQAMQRAFVASCGSMASVVHEMRSHSILWATVPSGQTPNEVHRHLGGNVYCLFYSGRGHLHKIDPITGFETVLIDINEVAPFQFIVLPIHSWYQPINTGETSLLYFMIHEPAFDRSELLTLEKQDCRDDWLFEYASPIAGQFSR